MSSDAGSLKTSFAQNIFLVACARRHDILVFGAHVMEK